MSKTKFGKKIVSLVLALTMLFAVSVSAISASAYTHGLVGRTAKLATKAVLPLSDKILVDAADVATDAAKAAVINKAVVKAAVGNALVPKHLKQFVAAKAILRTNDTLQLGQDLAIVGADDLLFKASSVDLAKEEALVLLNKGLKANALGLAGIEGLTAAHIKFHALFGGPIGVAPELGVLRDGILADVKDLTLEDAPLITAGTLLEASSLLPSHHPLPFVWLPIAVGLTPLSNILRLGTGAALRHTGNALAFVDTLGLTVSALKFNTPILDTLIAKNLLNAKVLTDLTVLHRVHQFKDVLGQGLGLASIGLGSALAAHNVFEILTEAVPAKAIADTLRFARVANFVNDLYKLHVVDNIVWNLATAKAFALPLALGTAAVAAATPVVAGAVAIPAAGLGLAGLTAANVAGAAALAAPVAGAALAAPVALGAGALGLGGLAAAGLAGAAALAAPVVATAVAAPIVGVAALGTVAAGATALGAGVLGTAALAANVLGNKDGSTTNPVDTVKNAVESVVPSNNQTTTTATENTESTENTQNDPAQAQTTAGTNNANVANTDGPID